MNEKEFYGKIKNWDFSDINCEEEFLTNWEMYEELKKIVNEESCCLDLGTGGGEKVIEKYPRVKEILATDFSEEMIETANQNLLKSNKKNITFKVMDNLKMDVKENYFDIVTARHTIIDPNQIYKSLKYDGYLLVRGVDKLDCWQLKRKLGYGQGYTDLKPISLIDFEAILDAGFKEVELIPIHVREFYKTKEDLYALLLKTPICRKMSEENLENNDFNINLDCEKIDEYINENTTQKGIKLVRRYYGIIAKK